jgi:AcrR family transcriptional regulator
MPGQIAAPERVPTRERIVLAAADLYRRHGYTGTGMKQVASDAEAPFGSIYHFFPGGKEQLGEEVIRRAGGMYALLLPAVFDPAPDPVTGVRTFFTLAGEHLRASGWQDACPIATVALEVSSTSEPMREACAEVFSGWVEAGTERFTAEGLEPEQARAFTLAIVAALEGAFVLARALRSTEPLDAAGEALAARAAELFGAS